MAPSAGRGASRKYGLCAGSKLDNELLAIDDLKRAFRELLQYKLKSLSKESWISQVVANPLYEQSRELVRFIVLAAAHRSVPDSMAPGTWKKEGVKGSEHANNFLNFRTWKGAEYATVEHVAPSGAGQTGWDDDLYRDNILRHTIGNLVLLPRRENSAIGSDSWLKKKKFYLALTEQSVDAQRQRFEEAEAAGVTFSRSTKRLLEDGDRLPLLDPLRSVEEWTRGVVVGRSRNIAGLCWDVVWRWLNGA